MRRLFDAVKSKVTGSPAAASTTAPPSLDSTSIKSFIASQMPSDPAQLKKMMESDQVKELLDDPEKFKAAINSSTMGRTMLAAYPQLATALEDKEKFAKVMSKLKNDPAAALENVKANKDFISSTEQPSSSSLPPPIDPIKAMRSSLNSPNKMSEMLQNPLVAELLKNPELLKSQIKSNPMLAKLAESNPILKEMMKNPESLSAAINNFKKEADNKINNTSDNNNVNNNNSFKSNIMNAATGGRKIRGM